VGGFFYLDKRLLPQGKKNGGNFRDAELAPLNFLTLQLYEVRLLEAYHIASERT
jgi:hypothetical protein